MSKNSRTKNQRRDRRKAKASGFVRPGRSNPKKIAHGGGGEVHPLVSDTVDVKGEVDLLDLKHQEEEKVPDIKLEDVCDGLELEAVQGLEAEIKVELPRDRFSGLSFSDAVLEAEKLVEEE